MGLLLLLLGLRLLLRWLLRWLRVVPKLARVLHLLRTRHRRAKASRLRLGRLSRCILWHHWPDLVRPAHGHLLLCLLLRLLLLSLLLLLLWLRLLRWSWLLHAVLTEARHIVGASLACLEARVELALLVLKLLLAPDVELIVKEHLVELLLRHPELGQMVGREHGRRRRVEVRQRRLPWSHWLLCALRLLLWHIGRHHGRLLARLRLLRLLRLLLLRLHLWCRRRSESGRLWVGLTSALTLSKAGTCHGHLVLVLHGALPGLFERRKVVAVLGS